MVARPTNSAAKIDLHYTLFVTALPIVFMQMDNTKMERPDPVNCISIIQMRIYQIVLLHE
jgi:hypothetical protein